MSNHLHIKAVKVTDLADNTDNYGFFARCETEEYWHAWWELGRELPADPVEAIQLLQDPLELFRRVCEVARTDSGLFDLIHEFRTDRDGLYINDDYHEWDEHPQLEALWDDIENSEPTQSHEAKP